MEETTDLREYIDIVVRRWTWILGIILVAVVTAGIGSLFIVTPTYEATATILAITAPKIVLSRGLETQLVFAEVETEEAKASVVEAMLASMEVEAGVVEKLQDTLPTASTVPGSLLRNVEVEQVDESGVFEISARADDPQRAAQIANAWAETGATVLREAQVAESDQASIAEQDLEAAEQALYEFADANGLSETDLRAFLGSGTGQSTASILSVEKRTDLARLLRARQIAEEIYLSFARQATAERVASEAGTGVKVVSQAAAPIGPVKPQTTLNIVLAGVLGLIVGVSGAFAAEYSEGWREDKNRG